jgi:hypothetical protein
MLGDLPGLASALPESLRLEDLAGETTGVIGRRLAEATVDDPALKAWLTRGGEALQAVAGRRSSVLHARPATDEEGRQRLYRWDATRRQAFWVTDEYLDELVEDIGKLMRSIDELRPRQS